MSTDGFSVFLANALLGVLMGTAPSTYSTIYWQLHAGAPGAAGTNNISAGSSARSPGPFATPVGGSASLTGTAPSWTNSGITEVVTDVTGWSLSSGGSFLTSGSACLPAPSGVTATQLGSGGTFGAAGNYFYVITAINLVGETIASAEVTQDVLATADEVVLAWTAVTGATGYKVYRGTVAAAENKLLTTIGSGATVTYTDTGTAGSSVSPPAVNTAGKAWAFNDTLQLAMSVALTPIAA